MLGLEKTQQLRNWRIWLSKGEGVRVKSLSSWHWGEVPCSLAPKTWHNLPKLKKKKGKISFQWMWCKSGEVVVSYYWQELKSMCRLSCKESKPVISLQKKGQETVRNLEFRTTESYHKQCSHEGLSEKWGRRHMPVSFPGRDFLFFWVVILKILSCGLR